METESEFRRRIPEMSIFPSPSMDNNLGRAFTLFSLALTVLRLVSSDIDNDHSRTLPPERVSSSESNLLSCDFARAERDDHKGLI